MHQEDLDLGGKSVIYIYTQLNIVRLTSRSAHHIVMMCHSVNVEQLSKFLAEVLTTDSRRTKGDEYNCIAMKSTLYHSEDSTHCWISTCWSDSLAFRIDG